MNSKSLQKKDQHDNAKNCKEVTVKSLVPACGSTGQIQVIAQYYHRLKPCDKAEGDDQHTA